MLWKRLVELYANSCSDKTGTFPQGLMVTRQAWIPVDGINSLRKFNDATNPTLSTNQVDPYSRFKTSTGRTWDSAWISIINLSWEWVWANRINMKHDRTTFAGACYSRCIHKEWIGFLRKSLTRYPGGDEQDGRNVRANRKFGGRSRHVGTTYSAHLKTAPHDDGHTSEAPAGLQIASHIGDINFGNLLLRILNFSVFIRTQHSLWAFTDGKGISKHPSLQKSCTACYCFLNTWTTFAFHVCILLPLLWASIFQRDSLS